MNAPRSRARAGLAPRSIGALAVVASLTSMGCARSIGDECQINTDCSANGDRTCDMSQPGGYCTIDGCDQTSCPEDSVCVRFFPEQFLSRPCNPACEDTDPPSSSDPTSAASRCPDRAPACTELSRTDDCSADEICLPAGLCAPRSNERRLCVKTCGGDDDCRGGYACRAAGTLGSVPLLADPCATSSFCAPLVK
ncbi:MAG TPA: hypothetical protein VFH68_24240 [Polyangia bacterium]|nr:hypothetical protein [Polyangia bacterium]